MRNRLALLMVADDTTADPQALRRFVDARGNLVPTESALRLRPALADVPAAAVGDGLGYVGDSDLDRSDPWLQGLYKRARQMFDPVGLGYPLLMERDQY